jgi:hypothetical protein
MQIYIFWNQEISRTWLEKIGTIAIFRKTSLYAAANPFFSPESFGPRQFRVANRDRVPQPLAAEARRRETGYLKGSLL